MTDIGQFSNLFDVLTRSHIGLIYTIMQRSLPSTEMSLFEEALKHTENTLQETAEKQLLDALISQTHVRRHFRVRLSI